MNTIDAIEGIVKTIIDQSFNDFISDRRDDSDYTRNVKTVLNALDTFFQKNIEVATTPVAILKEVIYKYAKEKWIKFRTDGEFFQEESPNDSDKLNDIEYLNYYYDYIYDRGVYPLWSLLRQLLSNSIGKNMPDSKEKQIRKELNNLTKSIDSILKKIEVEREKLQPRPLSDDAPDKRNGSENPPDKNSQQVEHSE